MAKKRKPNAAFMKPMTPSSLLAEVVGSKAIPRTEVTKKLWAYIKRNKLQDTKNRRMINADDALKAVFGGRGKVLLRLRKIVRHQIGFADVLVRSLVPRVEAQRLVVVLECKVEVAGLAPGVAEVILRVGVVRFARGNPLEAVEGRFPVPGFDRLLAALVIRVHGARVRRRPGVHSGGMESGD